MDRRAYAPPGGRASWSRTPETVVDTRRPAAIKIDTGRDAVSTRSSGAQDNSADSPEKRERSRQQRGLDTYQILVVDDDEIILAAVSGILAQEGFHVDTATNGSEALECVERTHPDVVLLDMRMPVLDGWAFARALRERDIDLKIVVMTAAQDARRWADEIGARAYLAKPFDLDDLIAIVERACLDD
jgi:CheY-like chemotaxis protein